MKTRTMTEAEFTAEAITLLKPLDNVDVSFSAKKGTKTDETATIKHDVKFTRIGLATNLIIANTFKSLVVEAQRAWRAHYKKTGKIEMNFAYEINAKGEGQSFEMKTVKLAQGKTKEQVLAAKVALELMLSEMTD